MNRRGEILGWSGGIYENAVSRSIFLPPPVAAAVIATGAQSSSMANDEEEEGNWARGGDCGGQQTVSRGMLLAALLLPREPAESQEEHLDIGRAMILARLLRDSARRNDDGMVDVVQEDIMDSFLTRAG